MMIKGGQYGRPFFTELMKDLLKVLIISTDGDFTVQNVTDWLNSFGVIVKRVCLFDHRIDYCISIDENNTLLLDNSITSYDKIWFHRAKKTIPNRKMDNIGNRILIFHKNELSKIYSYLSEQIDKKKYIVQPQKVDVNKLDVLLCAKGVNLRVPKWVVTNNKKVLYNFINENGDCIIKPLSNCFSFIDKGKSYSMFTKEIDKESILRNNELLFPVFVQKKVEKEYEVRTFYIAGQMYSMAIFSQLNAHSKVDWRKSQHEQYTRRVPYLLPKKYQKPIHRLMVKLGLKTGSLDFIVNKDGQLVFLEVNPVGQFGMVSELCNYSLYHKFANFIIN